MIDCLRQYDAIGWDFDGTLIDHPKSPLMHQHILTHPEQRHVIITFRAHGYERTLFQEMSLKYPDGPSADHFAGVENISDLAWDGFMQVHRQRKLGRYTGPATPGEDYFVAWKAMTCDKLRLPILIDDKTELVLPGCLKHGITYLHPDDL